MKPKDPKVEFIQGALIYAAGFVVAGLVLFSERYSVLRLASQGFFTGLLMQYFDQRVNRRVAAGKTAYRPDVVIGIGVVGAAFSFWCVSQPKSPDQWWMNCVLIPFGLISLGALYCGVRDLLRVRAANPPA